jgi:phosphoenolpyruvate phosphomutase
VVVPTTYPQVTATELEGRGVGAVIYANHALRSSVTAMRGVLARIASSGSTFGIEAELAPLKEIFAIQGMDDLLELQRRHDELSAQYAAG